MDSTGKYWPVSTTRETHLARHCGLCVSYCRGYSRGKGFPGRGYRRSLLRTSCRGFVLCLYPQDRNCENRRNNQHECDTQPHHPMVPTKERTYTTLHTPLLFFRPRRCRAFSHTASVNLIYGRFGPPSPSCVKVLLVCSGFFGRFLSVFLPSRKGRCRSPIACYNSDRCIQMLVRGGMKRKRH
jgi:hypothetical protein